MEELFVILFIASVLGVTITFGIEVIVAFVKFIKEITY